MTHLRLLRFNYGPTETEGRLIVPNVGRFYTIEPPWRDNQPNVSCVPDGVYGLEPHSSPKYGRTVALVAPSRDVYQYPEERQHDWQRYACLLHAANFAHQLEGCVAPGLFRGPLYSTRRRGTFPAVHRSGDALARILPRIMDGGATLSIRPALGAPHRQYVRSTDDGVLVA